MTPKLKETVQKRADKQRKCESEHKYNVEKFGLTEEGIRRVCAFYYDTFLSPLGQLDQPSWPAEAAPSEPAE